MRRKQALIVYLIAIVAALSAYGGILYAQSTDPTHALQPGGSLVITCPNILAGTPSADGKSVRLLCPSLVPTITPTPLRTATPRPTGTPKPTNTPMADHSSMSWHDPGAHGDIAAHEHGDESPQWLLDAGYVPAFDHVANTPNENALAHKHTSMKGWAGRFNNVDWYGIFHLDFNPGGHVSRLHSYQLWLRDNTGAVSHMHGWVDFGEDNNTGPNLIVACTADNPTRPIMLPRVQNCPFHFENWYARAGQAEWMPDLGFNINSNYYAGGDAADPATWSPIFANDATINLTRRIEFAWYAGRSDLRGDFWTTQFGDSVSGETDPLCDGLHTRTVGTRTYTILCLKQTIQPSLPTIQFPGNSIQRQFPGSSVVRLPN